MRKILSLVLAVLLILTTAPALAGSTPTIPKPRVKNLTGGSATSYADISLQSNQYVGAIVRWEVLATDGTDYHSRVGMSYVTAISKAGSITCTVADVGTTQVAVSNGGGTLTNTTTCVAGTKKITLKANAASSLTETTLQIRYFVDIIGPSTVTGY